MALVGRTLLILGLVVAVYGLGASLHGARTGAREWVDSARRAMYTLAAMMLFAFVILDVAFITSNFAYNIVATSSSTTTPAFYRAAAIWSTQQGSLLLWVLLLSMWSSLALFLTRRRVRDPKLHVAALVRYTGIVPDPFAAGRGVLVTVQKAGADNFVGQQNSLTTKCPSKYQAAAGASY